MALDHYVSQVHLRNFNSPALGGKMMYGVQKRTLKSFPCGSKDICRIDEGNTNDYLIDKRVIEDFLEYIEPFYNQAVDNFRNAHFNADSVFVIAGFASYILSCAPAAMRLSSHWLRELVKLTATIMDADGKIPPPPKELGGTSISDLLQRGKIKVDIDGKYPQALGITGIFDRTLWFGNSYWEILINEVPESPFFTSDFPVAIERSPDPKVLNRVMPLAPDIAVRIRPDINMPTDKATLGFPFFKYRMIKLNLKQVRRINQMIVRCAEDQVYYRDEYDWVMPFIKKNADFWIEPITTTFPTGKGDLLWSSMQIARREAS